jgi:Ni/Co efflux regulator RcnB
MNKLLLAVVASAFALGSASGFAADATKKKEELTAEQKTEIRDRVERLKADRARTEQGKVMPAKTEPKR